MADELILTISGEDRDLGDRDVPFTENYTINCNQETDITVTETLDSVVQIRSYTASANSEQKANIEMSGLSQGQHTLVITVTAGEVSATRTLTFTLPITYLSPIAADFGDVGEKVVIPYMTKTYSGVDVLVTELLDGEVHREYTAASGAEQEMTVNTEKLSDTEHTVEIIATGDGETKKDKSVFRVAPIVLSDGGSIQEMQDGNGDPVYPATIAKAVMLANGKSVEREFADYDYKVGDVKITARTDLGDKWLLCNGVRVSREVYEELGGVIPLNLTDEWMTKDLWDSSSKVEITCIHYANGYWVAGGQYYDGTTYYARIAYATDLLGSWKVKDLWNGSNSIVNSIMYADGYWVAGGYSNKVAYATTLSGTWTTKTVSVGEVRGIIRERGYWVVCGDSKMAYAVDLTGNWTTKAYAGLSIANCITYANGYWAVCGRYSQDGVYHAGIEYAADLLGDWTIQDIWSSASGNNMAECISYTNGLWVVGGFYNGNKTARIAYAKDLAGAWTTKDVWSVGNSNYLYDVVYARGYWVACGGYYSDGIGNAVVAYTDDIDGDWIVGDVWSSNTSVHIKSITHMDENLVIGCKYADDTKQYARIASYDMRNILLPVISTGSAYVYIKAKE